LPDVTVTARLSAGVTGSLMLNEIRSVGVPICVVTLVGKPVMLGRLFGVTVTVIAAVAVCP